MSVAVHAAQTDGFADGIYLVASGCRLKDMWDVDSEGEYLIPVLIPIMFVMAAWGWFAKGEQEERFCVFRELASEEELRRKVNVDAGTSMAVWQSTSYAAFSGFKNTFRIAGLVLTIASVDITVIPAMLVISLLGICYGAYLGKVTKQRSNLRVSVPSKQISEEQEESVVDTPTKSSGKASYCTAMIFGAVESTYMVASAITLLHLFMKASSVTLVISPEWVILGVLLLAAWGVYGELKRESAWASSSKTQKIEIASESPSNRTPSAGLSGKDVVSGYFYARALVKGIKDPAAITAMVVSLLNIRFTNPVVIATVVGLALLYSTVLLYRAHLKNERSEHQMLVPRSLSTVS